MGVNTRWPWHPHQVPVTSFSLLRWRWIQQAKLRVWIPASYSSMPLFPVSWWRAVPPALETEKYTKEWDVLRFYHGTHRKVVVPRVSLMQILIYSTCCLGAWRGRNELRMKLLASPLCCVCIGHGQETSRKPKGREELSWSFLVFLEIQGKTRRLPLPLVAFIITKVILGCRKDDFVVLEARWSHF